MNRMFDVQWIVVHCTSTKVSQKVTVKDIDRWHRAKGWARCGYHWVIYQDGTIHPGRPERYAGAHVRNHNRHAIGVCYVGGVDENGKYADTRTPEQKAALVALLRSLKEDYPDAVILGHRDLPNVHKDCPCFDAHTEYRDL